MPPKKTSGAPLQRGLACLSCRKRKLKCDGQKPVCSPCAKMKRPEECEYEDRRQKSRTQKLKEKLAMLEDRIKELEGSDPAASASSSTDSPGLFDQVDPGVGALGDVDQNQISLGGASLSLAWPSTSTSQGSSSSSSSSVGLSLSVPGSPFAFTGGQSWGDMDNATGSRESSFEMSPFTGMPNSMFPDMPHWDPSTPLPFENKKILLEIFISHRHQCWCFSDTTRLDILSNGESMAGVPEPHPALMNSIYLLACHFARSPYFSELESTFLTRALREITVALDNQDRLVDVVQASSLLAIYLYANSRILEGYCHSFSAARLAVGLGLHQIQYTDVSQSKSSSSSPSAGDPTTSGVMTLTAAGSSASIATTPPKDSAELRERISTFWQVFMVDRCWSVANGLPVALPDGEHHQGRIKTPWPDASLDDGITSVGMFDPLGNPVYMPSLKAKAAALYERTFRIASSVHPNWAEFTSTSNALQRFHACLPMFSGFEPWRSQAPFLDVELLAIHTIANVCTINLNKNNLEMDNVQAANYVLSLIKQLSQADYEWLDPLMSACWTTVAKLYIQMLSLSGASVSAPLPVYALEQELDVLVNAMKTLSAFFPLAGKYTIRS
ncbi:hypothetical protein GYMLUDRAFT_227493 [Collybiopsis luxurians FD-317 M1]|uniref:Zn(2)-C6 fungal-type domain-containing protein n=1 Tax=Collybiopsis luxurians FD-317 M1 TaxID=944289 RepID=A0A0D0CKU5_9AGAR|nr:hypothetical protein GYMLUDRAFT_227493 [Collybiopsis luxurians FD-317 M1]